MATVQNFEKSFQAPSTPEDAYCSGAVESTLKFYPIFYLQAVQLEYKYRSSKFFLIYTAFTLRIHLKNVMTCIFLHFTKGIIKNNYYACVHTD